MSITITLPTATFIRNIDGKGVSIDWSKVPNNVINELVVAGAKIILNNTYNGGGKDASETEKGAAMQKKLDAWYKGEFVVQGNDRQTTLMREVYVGRLTAAGATAKQVEEHIVSSVRAAFGEKAKATFTQFLEAQALAIAKEQKLDKDAVFGKLWDDLAAEAETLAQERAKASAKIDIKAIGLAAFKL